jgi:predicted metalloendopeptidase
MSSAKCSKKLPKGIKFILFHFAIAKMFIYFHEFTFRTIANYLIWRMTDYSIKYLTNDLRKRQLQHNAALSGQQEDEPRWKECIDVTSSSLTTALSALYVRKHFDNKAKASALEMVNSIRAVFENILKTISWMGAKAREAAVEKVHAMYTHIGHPIELTDDNKLIEYFKSVRVDDDKYLESILSINRVEGDRLFGKLREPINKTEWTRHSKQAQVNAFYSSVENSISERMNELFKQINFYYD